MYYEWVFLRSEIAWGTHEPKLPKGAHFVEIEPERGQSNVILLPQKSKDATIRSWSPTKGEYIGYTVTHEENYEISLELTVKEGKKLVYRPTINFAYRPTTSCLDSIKEINNTPGHALQPNRRILSKEIVSGADHLGALTMGHVYNGWWTGSLLDIHEARELTGIKHNATTLQVAVGLLSGVVWMLKNKNAGVLSPSDLPHREVLPSVYPFLGPFVSIPTKWRPNPTDQCNWSFKEFMIENKK